MRIAHAEDLPWTNPPALRGGTIRFKTLLEGIEGTPNNYQMFLADTDVSFSSPRHRHNFDQVRFGIAGRTSFGPKQMLAEGDTVYFPEGTHYGPQDQHETGSSSISLVIQFGGPDGNGYMSHDQMRLHFERLSATGTFDSGVFRRHTPAAHERANQDAYEAVWQSSNGRAVQYSKPRFAAPLHMHEAHFAWMPIAGSPGTSTKRMGCFTERDIDIGFTFLEAGSTLVVPPSKQIRLMFVKEGTGSLGLQERWQNHTAIELPAGESIQLRASASSTLLTLNLPHF